jgi:hypothetical protein
VAALGLDPVNLRRRTLSVHGGESPTREVLGIGYASEHP